MHLYVYYLAQRSKKVAMRNLYEVLNKMGFVDTQHEFSTEWLGEQRSYYSSYKAKDREFGIKPMIRVCRKLNLLCSQLRREHSREAQDNSRLLTEMKMELENKIWSV